ncbi:MAG: hypothetical protein ACOZNI_27700, partial [Myxococcota bacterium]
SAKAESAGGGLLQLFTFDPMHATPWIKWETSVLEALRRLGGRAHLSDLYGEVARLRRKRGLALSATYEATIRRTLQFSRGAAPVRGRPGYWRLIRPHRASSDDTA